MEFRIPLLLFLFVFHTWATLATQVQRSPFKEIVCNQCQQWCDEDGRWTVFQRRMVGKVDFYRGWEDYVKGFGHRHGDHWLGLEELHERTKEGDMELEINMITKNEIRWVAKYSNFSIGPGSDKYRLHISGYSGNATDALARHNNQQFTTKDADHDSSFANCARMYEGAWWYWDCADSNLNGNFNKTDYNGIWWTVGKGGSLRFSDMKFRERL